MQSPPLLILAVSVALIAACSRDPLLGTWYTRSSDEGRDATKYVEGSYITFDADGTFSGLITDQRETLIVQTSGTYVKDGDTIDLTGTQTLVKSAGRGEVGSSKPYKLRLKVEPDRLVIEPRKDKDPSSMVVYLVRID
jgi:hypothetical protein